MAKNKKARNKRENSDATTFGEFIVYLPMLTDECLKKDLEILNKAKRPDYICKRKVPENLNMINFGQYSDLCDAMGEEYHIVAIIKIIQAIYPDITEKEIYDSAAYDVWGFANFAVTEAKKINDVFSSIKMTRTSEEIAAGIDRLQFGTFGILDWYAKRMGITDQNEVYTVAWARIYQCMANDTEEAEYNRRLQKVYTLKAKK